MLRDRRMTGPVKQHCVAAMSSRASGSYLTDLTFDVSAKKAFRFLSIRQKSRLFVLCRRFAEVILIGNTAKGDFRTDIATLDLRLGAE